MIKIKVVDYYNKPAYYRFMPTEIFNALELAELKGAVKGKQILAEVPKHLYDKMLEDIKNYEQNKI